MTAIDVQEPQMDVQGSDAGIVLSEPKKRRKPRNLRELRLLRAKERGEALPTREKRAVTHKKCTKCGEIKEISSFGKHDDTADGHQSYCKSCKNKLGKRRHKVNAAARIKHHFSTRIAIQLGELAPPGLVEGLEGYLGYTIGTLTVALRKELKSREGASASLTSALEAGYHIDHVKALSKFEVIKEGQVDWEEFRRCWAITNLRAVPALENLKKGARDE